MTSATGAPGAGGVAGTVVVEVVVDDFLLVLGGIGVIRSASPSVDDEHPATSNKIAISAAIRIPARLAGRLADAFQHVGKWCSLTSGDARTHGPRDDRVRHR
jgi:hypothetical protein